MKAKLIEYAYPTSIHAERVGMGKTGCWFVSLYDSETGHTRSEVIKHFLVKANAEQFAESLPNPYNWMHKYHNHS